MLALLEVGNRQAAKCQASDLGFTIAPRLNAAGRLDNMSLGVACLLSDDLQQAKAMARQLDSLNSERRVIEREMQQQALAALDKLRLKGDIPVGLCLFNEKWHQGVSGIIAGRLKEQLHRPVIVFAAINDTEIKGSARSVTGLHIRDVLEAVAKNNPNILEKFGGHAMAAGLTIKRQDFDAFNHAFINEIDKRLSKACLRGEIYTDGELQKEEFSIKMVQLLQESGPWGQAFPEPLFDGCFRVLAQRLVADKHLKLSLSYESHLLDGIAFNVNTYHWPNPRVEKIRAAYRLAINEFNGIESVQLIVEYLEAI
jgi:single-stranded-DNA-specific exonuclease